jgi:hypothetical protein
MSPNPPTQRWNSFSPSTFTTVWLTALTLEPDVPAANFGSEWVQGTRVIVIRRGYAGLFRYRRGRIEEVSLEDFIGNRPVHVGKAPDEARGRDIVLRARSRLGECRYDILNNNCEHFCNWCLRGESRSPQVESLTRPARALVHLGATCVAFFPNGALSRWSVRAVPS